MADTSRDIELRLRARDLSTAELKQVIASVNELSSSLDKQLAAASRLEIKERELRTTLTQLDQAAKNVTGLTAVIERTKLLSDEVAKNRTELDRAADALHRHRQAMSDGTATGREATTSLSGFEKALAAAQTRLDRNSSTLGEYRQKLESAGVEVNDLIAAEKQLVATATQIGDSRTKLNATLLTYARLEREAKEAAKASAQASKDAAEAAKQEAAAKLAVAKADIEARRARLGSGPTGFREFSQRVDREKELTAVLSRLNRERHNDETRQARATVDAIRKAEQEKRQAIQETANFRPPQPTAVPGQPRTDAMGRPGRGASAQAGFLGLRPYEWTNLGYQVNDVFSGIASGQNMTQILAQQGGQFLQIFGRAALRWFPLVAVAVTGVTVAIASLTSHLRILSSNREFTAALTANKFAVDQSAESLTRLRRELQDTGVAWDDAGKAARATIQGGVLPERRRDVLTTARAISRVEGIDITDATRQIIEGTSGGIEQFDKLISRFQAIEPEQVKYIRNLFRSGQEQKANVETLRLLGEAYRKAEQQYLSDLDRKLIELRTSWNRFIEDLGNSKSFDTLITKLTELVEWLTKGIEATDNFVKSLDSEKVQTTLSWLAAYYNVITYPARMAGRGIGMAADAVAGYHTTPTPPVASTGISLPGLEGARLSVGSRALLPEGAAEYLKVLAEATKALPEGWKAIVESAHRPGAVVAGKGTPSEHAGVNAFDVRVVGPDGRPETGFMGRGGPVYEILDRAVAAAASARDMSVAIGTDFGKPDSGHYSFNGVEAARQAGRLGRVPAGGVTGRTGTTNAAAAEDLRLSQQRYDLARAATRDEEIRLKLEEKRFELVGKGIRGDELKNNLAAEEKNIREDINREDYAFNQQQSKQYEEDKRQALDVNAIRKAGIDAAVKARADGRSKFDEIRTIQKTAEAEERQNQQKRKQELDQLDQLEKQVAEERRKNNQEQKSSIDRLTEAVNIHYDGIIKNIEKARERSNLADKERYDNAIKLTEVERARALARVPRDAAEEQAKQALQTRTDLIQTYTKLEAAGEITITEKEDKIKKAFDLTRESILGAAQALEDFVNKNRNDLTPTEIEKFTARVKELRAEVKYIDPFWKGLKETFSQSFSTGLTTAFESVSEAIGGAIAKTKQWKDVWSSVKSAAANFFASLLKDLAGYILKAQAAKLASNLFGGGGGFLGGLFGGGASSATGALDAADVSVLQTAVFERGGVAGRVPASAIDSWWASAPRYRTGTVVGLAPDEQRAILHRGEEVLSADNPRNILNGGGGGGAISIRNVLVDDRRRIAEAMAGAHGERVIVQAVVRNGATIRELARG